MYMYYVCMWELVGVQEGPVDILKSQPTTKSKIYNGYIDDFWDFVPAADVSGAAAARLKMVAGNYKVGKSLRSQLAADLNLWNNQKSRRSAGCYINCVKLEKMTKNLRSQLATKLAV